MRSFAVAGRSAATVATANHVGAQLWNASANRSIWVTAFSWFKTVATADNIGLARSSTRGTPGSTVTPVQQNDVDYDSAPGSGALLDLAAFTAQPTIISTAALNFRSNMAAAVGAGFYLPLPKAIEVPAGTGLVLLTPQAVILQPGDVSFFWDE